jgi:hypothetical protein
MAKAIKLAARRGKVPSYFVFCDTFFTALCSQRELAHARVVQGFEHIFARPHARPSLRGRRHEGTVLARFQGDTPYALKVRQRYQKRSKAVSLLARSEIV